MADETFTLDDLHELRVPDGRCPHCGRPSSADEGKVFKELRDELASATGRADRAEKQVENLKEERDGLKVRNADLRDQNRDLRAG